MIKTCKKQNEDEDRGEDFGAHDPEALAWAIVGSLNTIMEEQLTPEPRIDRDKLTEVIRLILARAKIKEDPS